MVEKINLEKMLELLATSCERSYPELEDKPVWNHALKSKGDFELIEGECYTNGMVLGVDYIPIIGEIEVYFDNRSEMDNEDLETEPELNNKYPTAIIHAIVGMGYQRPKAKRECDVQVIYQRFILQEKKSKVSISDSEFTDLLKSI